MNQAILQPFGFRAFGVWGLGFRGLGFRGLEVRVYRVQPFKFYRVSSSPTMPKTTVASEDRLGSNQFPQSSVLSINNSPWIKSIC